MPFKLREHLSGNFEGSSFMWHDFKKSGGRSIIGLPFFLCEAALLPFRAIYDYKNRDSDSRLG